MTTNQHYFDESKKYVPGGVHSPVRSFKGLPMDPRFFVQGQGALIEDCEGKKYIDFCMSFGPLILGHANPVVKEAIVNHLDKGWSYGACEPYSYELAKYLVEKLPSPVEQIRFVNSGTEAVMTALRIARGATGRSKVLKFSRCYHGHTDGMLIKAGSGLAGEAESSSAGVSQQVADETLICELGDLTTVQKAFDQYGKDIAAIIVEPLPANCGLIPLEQNFLNQLRDITKEHGSLLIFDEVISGFRCGFQGMTNKLGITPDLITYGKIIGGGMPVGAVAGPKQLMERLAPVGDVYQAGTLSANPLAMVAGKATLDQLDEKAYNSLATTTQKIVEIFNKWISLQDDAKIRESKVHSSESLFWIESESFNTIFENFLEKGIYLAPNAYEVGFVSTAHNADILGELESKLL